MSIGTFNRGTTVLIELEYKKRQPFGTAAYFDPSTTPTVTVQDPHGTTVADAQDATQSATGKWYYLLQTEVAWQPGDYTITADPTDGTYIGMEVTDPEDAKGFHLE
jgi:hypothetical protein